MEGLGRDKNKLEKQQFVLLKCPSLTIYARLIVQVRSLSRDALQHSTAVTQLQYCTTQTRLSIIETAVTTTNNLLHSMD